MPFERALPGAKDVFPLSPDDPADELPAVSEAPYDLFDRHIVLRQRENRAVDLFPPLIAFILKALGSSEQLGIDCRRPNGAVRIWRIVLRTASRKARLAFSIRCQRSATWVA